MSGQGTPSSLYQGPLLPSPHRIATGPKANYLECELGGAHHFYDVEGSPADVIPQHLQLLRRKGLIRKPKLKP